MHSKILTSIQFPQKFFQTLIYLNGHPYITWALLSLLSYIINVLLSLPDNSNKNIKMLSFLVSWREQSFKDTCPFNYSPIFLSHLTCQVVASLLLYNFEKDDVKLPVSGPSLPIIWNLLHIGFSALPLYHNFSQQVTNNHGAIQHLAFIFTLPDSTFDMEDPSILLGPLSSHGFRDTMGVFWLSKLLLPSFLWLFLSTSTMYLCWRTLRSSLWTLILSVPL